MKGRQIYSNEYPLTTKDLQRLFRVTYMTIFNWRRRNGLPFAKQLWNTRYMIRFDPRAVRKWAAENDKDYLVAVAKELGVE